MPPGWLELIVYPWIQSRARSAQDPGNYDELRNHTIALWEMDPGAEPPAELPGFWHHGEWGGSPIIPVAGGRTNPGETPGPPDASRTGGNIMAGWADLANDTVDCIWSKRGDIANAYRGWDTATPAQKRGALSDWWGYTAEARGKTPSQFAQSLGCLGSSALPGGALPALNLTGIVDWAKANPIPAVAGGYLLLSLLKGR